MKHGQKPKSEYGRQLAEKQELKETYGVRERQFRRYFKKGSGPQKIVRMLEMRIDNALYKSGFAQSVRAARQLVTHGHIQVNGKNVDIPSLPLRINDVLSIHPLSRGKAPFKDLELSIKKYEAPPWIALDKVSLTAKIGGYPSADDPLVISRIKPIIEFYSR